MRHRSTPDLLVLHAVRIAGFTDTPAIAARFDLDLAQTDTLLRDFDAHGWTTHITFGDTAGWSLTERGRTENERQLSAELTVAGGADVHAVYREFLPLNGKLLQACTDWQLRPAPGDRLTPNDHTDPTWDADVLQRLATIDRALPPLIDRRGTVLIRFRGYDTRFTTALTRARAGDLTAVDRTDTDSCHRVWFELPEDLIATLGIERYAQSWPAPADTKPADRAHAPETAQEHPSPLVYQAARPWRPSPHVPRSTGGGISGSL